MIAVWRALEKGDKPGPEYVRNRMRDYIRKLHRESRHEETEEYVDDRGTARSPLSEREALGRRVASGVDPGEL